MMTRNKLSFTRCPAWLMPGAACMAAGIAIGAVGVSPSLARQTPVPPTAVNPQERTLDANLYMQTSAEYRACCLQTYGWATERLRQKLTVLPNETPSKRPAVVMDLDETVLDNSRFQTWLDERRLTYNQNAWEDWERNHAADVGLVPGAKAFIENAEKMGVTVLYITNRAQKTRAGTVAALKQVGLNTEGIENVPGGGEGRLMLQEGSTSDKTARRAKAEQEYRVLLYVGDNLRDFSDEFATSRTDVASAGRQAITERGVKVERSAYRFGGDWFVLPNPVYGEWQKPLGSTTATGRALLRSPATPINVPEATK